MEVADGGFKFPHIHQLHEVEIRPFAESLKPVFQLAPPGDHDNAQSGMAAADASGDGQSIFAGKTHVQQENIG